jgi:hypothetical protein
MVMALMMLSMPFQMIPLHLKILTEMANLIAGTMVLMKVIRPRSHRLRLIPIATTMACLMRAIAIRLMAAERSAMPT